MKQHTRRLLALLITGLVILTGVLAFNTVRNTSRQISVSPSAPATFDARTAAEKLAAGVRFRTLSRQGSPDASAAEFEKLHQHLEKQFPHAHAAMQREKINGYSLLFTWQGTDSKARPIAFMAHQDVVPVAIGTEDNWQEEPYSGAIRDGFIWGRGAWDDKGNLYGILEAIDQLAASGFKPRQTLYVIAGHDEEVGGQHGAKAIAGLLRSRGIQLDFILDEGLLITDGMLSGLSNPLALIGIAEKGYLSVNLQATGVPGHSSMPPAQTAIGSMSRALAALERNPLPAHMSGIAREMLETIAPEMPLFNRIVLSNLWLTAPLVRAQFENSPSTNALIRTTTALTIFNAGNKDNVLPGKADATVNFRLLPGESSDTVLEHVRRTISDNAIKATTVSDFDLPSGVSATDSDSYKRLHTTIRQVFPGTLVAPGLMLGATDARHFQDICDRIYRFSPIRARPEDLPRFHGTNERISIQNYVELIQFYRQLILNSGTAHNTNSDSAS